MRKACQLIQQVILSSMEYGVGGFSLNSYLYCSFYLTDKGEKHRRRWREVCRKGS